MNPAEVLDAALDTVARPLRGLSGLARLVAGLAATAVVLAIAAWSVRLGWLAGFLISLATLSSAVAEMDEGVHEPASYRTDNYNAPVNPTPSMTFLIS